tara:strand:+ start:1110 stop:2738 length:1629 start_codon:yes stop_codon:yes gene_type:complete
MSENKPMNIGSRLELFVDDFLIDKKFNVERQIHNPEPKEVVIKFDEPWEGKISAYYTLLDDIVENSDGSKSKIIRMYYRAADIDLESMKTKKTITNGQRTCYAESRDNGKTWIKPNLGLFEYDGSFDNNIIWTDIRGSENFTPFIDTNPNCSPDAKYKAIGSRLNPYLLFAFKSADGINWDFLREEELLTFYHGKFDTQNIAFWNENLGKYCMFFRDYLDKNYNIGRGIKLCLSDDFIHWTHFNWLKYGDNLNQQEYQLYTSSIQKYFRAPHILIGFPNRFNQQRQGWSGHPQSGVFDSIFMSSRDGFNWNRINEAIFRPGMQKKRWVSRNNLMALGMYQTISDLDNNADELSVLSSEGYYLDTCALRRWSWRLDGFVSLRAGFNEGDIITKTFVFSGKVLFVNLSTSAMGWLKVEILDGLNGKPLPGFQLINCHEIFGDSCRKMVAWKPRAFHEERTVEVPRKVYINSDTGHMIQESEIDPDLDFDDKAYVAKTIMIKEKRRYRSMGHGYNIKDLAGRPIKLRFRMKDCDLYSFIFSDRLF